MNKMVQEHVDGMDVVISAAAVADYRPSKCSEQKLPSKNKALTIQLVPTIDILKGVASKLTKKPFMVGFALESKDHLARARLKLRDKDVDMLVVNDVSALNAAESQVWILRKNKAVKLAKMAKINSAIRIFDYIVKSL